MKVTAEYKAELMTLQRALDYYYHFGVSTAVNDGKHITLETEKPLAGKHEGQM